MRAGQHGAAAGFSLLELILVIVVVTVMTTIVIPTLASQLNAANARSAAMRFISAHGLAKATALREGRTAELHIDGPNARFWIEVDTSAAGVGVMDTVRDVFDVTAGPLVMASTRSLVCFDAQGMPTTRASCEAADLEVTFTVTGWSQTVTANPLGKILR